jgi:hypothetical protein
MKILNKEKFESLVLKNWTEFINYKDIFLTIKEKSLSLVNSMPTIKVNTSPLINSRVIMTRFEYQGDSIAVWFDFHVTIEQGKKYIAGTIEYLLDKQYELNYSNIEATLFIV